MSGETRLFLLTLLTQFFYQMRRLECFSIYFLKLTGVFMIAVQAQICAIHSRILGPLHLDI